MNTNKSNLFDNDRSVDFEATVTAVVAAFGDQTRRDIFTYVTEAPVTANQVAEKFQLHPNVARHHLDKLVSGGYLDVVTDKNGVLGVGRPAKRYRRPGNLPNISSQNTKRDELLSMLLTATLEALDSKIAEDIAYRVGLSYGSKLASQMGPVSETRSVRNALLSVADALTAHGFATHAKEEGRLFSLQSDNCPFGNAALSNPVICALDRGLVSGMLNNLITTEVELKTTSKARGDSSCTLAV
jgi:predicted ArsR family transcriptional regulator